MSNEERLTPAERELEAALSGLRPASPGVDRDRLMFRAGQASARQRQRVWQGATAVLAAAFGVSLAIRPAPRQVDRFVYVTSQSPGSVATTITASADVPPFDKAEAAAQAQYIRLREAVLNRGIDALLAYSVRPAAIVEPPPRVDRLRDASTHTPQKWGFFGLERLINMGDQL